MFRRGGSTSSAGTGITSGLQAPRQGYAEPDGPVEKYVYDARTATPEQTMAEVDRLNQPKARNNKDLFIDFGLDLISRPGSGGSIFENIGSSGQKAYNQYRTNNRALDKANTDRQSDLFTTLIGAQAKMKGSEASGKTYNSIVIAEKLAEIIPEMSEIQERIDAGTNTPEDITRMEILRAQRNNLSKTDVTTDALIKMYTESNPTALGDKVDLLLLNDQKLPKENRKYTGPNDPQILKDAVAAIREMFESFSYASGGRAGYANGELVEEQVTDNPISYEQLRARLPQEITDDIVQLMSNSAEALEDFAMISTQQNVDQFNKRYSVNLVLPAEA